MEITPRVYAALMRYPPSAAQAVAERCISSRVETLVAAPVLAPDLAVTAPRWPLSWARNRCAGAVRASLVARLLRVRTHRRQTRARGQPDMRTRTDRPRTRTNRARTPGERWHGETGDGMTGDGMTGDGVTGDGRD